MFCWKDRWYCKDADKCANAEGCNRVLSEAEQMRAAHEGFPICWASGNCSKFRKKNEKEKDGR